MRSVEIPSDVPESLVIGFARCHQIEMWLREMVYLEIKAYFGLEYWEQCKKAMGRGGVQGIPPEKSQTRDRRHGHMATAENDPIWFLSFDALLAIIFDDQLWPRFEPYLTTKSILKSKMEEISLIRNRIAHVRALHQHDLDRLHLILRELDEGIFTFCSSYGERLDFSHEKNNEIQEYFSKNGPWLEPNARINLDVKCSYRPSATASDIKNNVGVIYHFKIYAPMRERHYFDYRGILKESVPTHKYFTHLVLDEYQQSLDIFAPAVVGAQAIIENVQRLYWLCANSSTFRRLAGSTIEQSSIGLEEMRALQRPFEDIALEWPHYVVPPSHPYAILDPSCTPCTMFGA